MVFVALIGVLTLLCSVDEFKDDFFASRRTKGFVLGGMGVCFLLLFVVTLVDCIKETKNQIQQQADLEMGKLNLNLIEESERMKKIVRRFQVEYLSGQ